MLDSTTKFDQFKNNRSGFNGVIVKLTDGTSTWLFGNMEAKLTDGHVYKKLKGIGGVKQSCDIYESTSTRNITDITLSNAPYKLDSSGEWVRASEVLEDITNKQVKIYFTPTDGIDSLSECVQPFSGSVKQLNPYDEKTYKITLADRGDVFNHQLLQVTMNDNVNHVYPLTPEDNKYVKVPLVWGSFKKGKHGLAKVWRLNDASNFVIAAHSVAKIGNFYIKEGYFVWTIDKYWIISNTAAYANIQWIPDDNGIYQSRSPLYKLTKNTGPGSEGVVQDESFVYDNNTPPTAAIIKPGRIVGRRSVSRVYWDILNDNEQRQDLKAVWEGSPNALLHVYSKNVRLFPYHSSPGWRGAYQHFVYRLHYWINSAGTDVDRILIADIKEYDTPTEKLSVGIKFADQTMRYTPREYRGLELYLAYTPFVGESAPAYSDVVATIEDLKIQLSNFYSGNDEEAAKSQKGPWAVFSFADVDGRKYGDWITDGRWVSESNVWTNRWYGNFNQLIEHPVTIFASMLLDPMGHGLTGLLSIDDLDVGSFADAIIGHKARMDILEEDTTTGDAATQLAKQSTFIPFVSQAGKVKMIALRYFFGYDHPVDDTIRYDEIIPGSLKIGKTPEDKIVNHLTVKSKWFEEEEKFKDETVYENSTSQAKYGIRKAAVEWKNVDDEDYVSSVNGSAILTATHLIDHIKNGENGLWSWQHNTVELKTFGQSHALLEIGDRIELDSTTVDRIELDSTTVDPHIKCHGDSWSGKRFLVTSINHTGKESRIKGIMIPRNTIWGMT